MEDKKQAIQSLYRFLKLGKGHNDVYSIYIKESCKKRIKELYNELIKEGKV